LTYYAPYVSDGPLEMRRCGLRNTGCVARSQREGYHREARWASQGIAFQADRTRVCAFVISPEISPQPYPEIRISDRQSEKNLLQSDSRCATLPKYNL
jgi:hypothetical protein